MPLAMMSRPVVVVVVVFVLWRDTNGTGAFLEATVPAGEGQGVVPYLDAVDDTVGDPPDEVNRTAVSATTAATLTPAMASSRKRNRPRTTCAPLTGGAAAARISSGPWVGTAYPPPASWKSASNSSSPIIGFPLLPLRKG